jgi:hypothetical protein
MLLASDPFCFLLSLRESRRLPEMVRSKRYRNDREQESNAMRKTDDRFSVSDAPEDEADYIKPAKPTIGLRRSGELFSSRFGKSPAKSAHPPKDETKES